VPEPADHQRPLLPLLAAHPHPAPTQAPPLAGLRYVEIETSRYCNRTCSWCPNGHTTTRRAQQLMDWHLFAKITAELGTAAFAGFFAFHNYNEPLANPRLFEEIAQVRRDIPEATPAIYTNGDLLNPSTVERLSGQGMTYLRVTRYPTAHTSCLPSRRCDAGSARPSSSTASTGSSPASVRAWPPPGPTQPAE
jgi:hypothetical protein